MLVSGIIRENLLDDFIGQLHHYYTVQSSSHEMMKTDIQDKGSYYEMEMSLPGVRKEDVKAELKDGYLTIGAKSSSQSDEQSENGKYIRRERYAGVCSRSFYVGEDVRQEDIKAKFEDGVLKLQIPKKEEEQAVESNNYIAIEQPACSPISPCIVIF